MITHDKKIADRALYLGTQARDSVIPYAHSEIGFNYRMSNVLAAVGVAQLKMLPVFLARRKAIYNFYKSRLQHIPGINFLRERENSIDSNWLTTFLYTADNLNNASSFTTGKIMENLSEAGIESRPIWTPLHTTKLYEDRPFYGDNSCKEIFRTGICLPSGSNLTDEQLTEICEIVLQTIA